MGKNGGKDPVARARKKVARAQSGYMKAVAKGEREIRNVRALADERIARAKAEFELRANELADVERSAAAEAKPASSRKGKSPAKVTAMPAAHGEPELAATNGASPAPRRRNKNGRFAPAGGTRPTATKASTNHKPKTN